MRCIEPIAVPMKCCFGGRKITDSIMMAPNECELSEKDFCSVLPMRKFTFLREFTFASFPIIARLLM
jgi:hypothetical protein